MFPVLYLQPLHSIISATPCTLNITFSLLLNYHGQFPFQGIFSFHSLLYIFIFHSLSSSLYHLYLTFIFLYIYIFIYLSLSCGSRKLFYIVRRYGIKIIFCDPLKEVAGNDQSYLIRKKAKKRNYQQDIRCQQEDCHCRVEKENFSHLPFLSSLAGVIIKLTQDRLTG